MKVPEIQVLVVSTGKIITLSIDPTWKVEELKKQIQYMGGPAAGTQRLSFGPHQLVDDRQRLDEFMIQQDSKLYLRLRSTGG